MTTLPTKYDFKEVEEGRYQIWLENRYFEASNKKKPPFTIIMPPPNVTGKLHLGHAWDGTLQDIIIRRKRMQGFDALFLPGMDHAGIATQAVVEEKLRQEGISRYDLGREKFIETTLLWKDQYSQEIRKQWELLGLSVDYTKETFTLDVPVNEAVNHVFIELYNRGKLYRSNRIISFDPKAKTALSNIEVNHVDEVVKLYYFKYPLVGENKFLTIATTRPETMFADQALMVHPDDKRYQKFISKTVYIPGTKTIIPVISDEFVDVNFGTGVVKVTPAHDQNDFFIGEKHNLPMPLCMNEDGTMNELALHYVGQDRFLCRKNVVNDLEKLGLVDKIEDYLTSIGYSERTNVVVEPRLSLQWFVKMDELAHNALKTKTEFVPPHFKKIYENWLNDIQDWTISRQLWWGHRIPAWYKGERLKVQVDSPGEGWIQDEDVLDTWFSSALWPLVTLGWPNDLVEFNHYYPTSVLVTAYDIIFFWVARMIFQAIEFTKEDPFEHVLIHGLIRDSTGRKMSKSLGNGVDPFEVASKYGVDALRYFLATNSAPGADLRYEEEKVESSWNFINKLWNITRFIKMNVSDTNNVFKEDELSLVDQWILTRLTKTIEIADYNYEKYEFGEASRVLYNFIWNDFADVYIEFAKVTFSSKNDGTNTKAVLIYVLESILKLLHPFMPFVTEKLFLEISQEETIVTSEWPSSKYVFSESEKYFAEINDIIYRVRNIRNENNIIPSKPLKIHLVVSDLKTLAKLSNESNYLMKFLNAPELKTESVLSTEEETILLTTSNTNIYIVKADIIDPKKEKKLLMKQKETLEFELLRSKKMLANEKFLNKAPQDKIEEEQEKQKNYQKQYNDIIKKIKNYE